VNARYDVAEGMVYGYRHDPKYKEFFDKYDAVLMANHGFIVGAKTIEDAYLKLELAESYAQVVLNTEISDVKVLENKKSGISRKAEMLQELEPFQFLRIKQGNMEPSKQDVKLVEDLSLMTKLDPGVINVLLDYVMLNKQNTLPYNYVMKIASSLVRENISTALEAMEYFNSFKTKHTTTRTRKIEKYEEEIVEPKPINVEKNVVSKPDDEEDDLEYEMLKEAVKEKMKNETVEI
jgi:replication initiation and membrane attachment protein DnaB